MDKTLGIYIHIPFCASKCSYCDFYSLAGCDRLMPKYQDALVEHIRESYPALKGRYIDTVYFGGGTPSYYGANRLIERRLQGARQAEERGLQPPEHGRSEREQ